MKPRTRARKAASWKNEGWTSVPNSLIRNAAIPWDVRMVFVWMASHTEEFDFDVEDIAAAGPDGRDKAYERVRALEEAGLITRHRNRDEKTGQLTEGVIYELHPRPVPSEQRTAQPRRAKPTRTQRVHPGSKAARQQNRSSDLIPDRAGTSDDQAKRVSAGQPLIPDLPGTGGPVTGGSGMIYKEEKTNKEEQPPPPTPSTDTPALKATTPEKPEEEAQLGNNIHPQATQFVRRLPPGTKAPSKTQRAALINEVARLLDGGADSARLRRQLMADMATAQHHYAVYLARAQSYDPATLQPAPHRAVNGPESHAGASTDPDNPSGHTRIAGEVSGAVEAAITHAGVAQVGAQARGYLTAIAEHHHTAGTKATDIAAQLAQLLAAAYRTANPTQQLRHAAASVRHSHHDHTPHDQQALAVA